VFGCSAAFDGKSTFSSSLTWEKVASRIWRERRLLLLLLLTEKKKRELRERFEAEAARRRVACGDGGDQLPFWFSVERQESNGIFHFFFSLAKSRLIFFASLVAEPSVFAESEDAGRRVRFRLEHATEPTFE